MLRRKQYDGQIFWSYVLAYATARFFHEFLRADPRGFLFGGALSTSQFIAIVGVTIALGMLARLKGKHEPMDPAESTS
jgi:prolipoprotein diacylglyceryltransferase